MFVSGSCSTFAIVVIVRPPISIVLELTYRVLNLAVGLPKLNVPSALGKIVPTVEVPATFNCFPT